eukprot:COSAG05_NODE_2723_length_2726_cov_3.067377_3_plen_87_part_00
MSSPPPNHRPTCDRVPCRAHAARASNLTLWWQVFGAYSYSGEKEELCLSCTAAPITCSWPFVRPFAVFMRACPSAAGEAVRRLSCD